VADKILIWGAGAIGGTLGAYWARAGKNVLLVDRNSEHVSQCRHGGISIEGPVEKFTKVIPALTPNEIKGEYDCIVLAVKALHTEEAMLALTPHLAKDGFVLSAQNGLNELTIAKHVGEKRTMGAFINFGADWIEPGRILFGNRGAVVVGEITPTTRNRTRKMHEVLKIFEPNAILTNNIWGYLWGKLAYGAMLFATALTNDSMTENFDDINRQCVWISLGREVINVARARGESPIGFNGFNPESFEEGNNYDEARLSIKGLAEFNRFTVKTHSGVWRDLSIRHRKTEIDQQIGIISELAQEVGQKTPMIDTLVQLIHDIEDGRRPQSYETLEVLIDKCPKI
jgi:2-dehydropantoate 2-reductase